MSTNYVLLLLVYSYANEICDAIVADCFTDRLETLKKAQIVFMLWVELEAVDAVLVCDFVYTISAF